MRNDARLTVALGKYNTLRIVRKVDFGVYLDGGQDGDILMPRKYVPDTVDVGDMVDVFVYRDSEDRLVATTEKPLAQVGDFAYLKVKTVSRFGAFLDWGLTKDLLVPYREQRDRMEVDKSYVVYIFVDPETKRIAASEKVGRYLGNLAPRFKAGDEVDILVAEKTDIGYKAIINNSHYGMLYANELYQPVSIGMRCKAYINRLRDDDKIDLTLRKTGYNKVDDLKEVVIRKLKENGGYMAVGDKTDAQTILLAFGCSKKAFKMAIGTLYKNGIIDLKTDGITLLI